ncbi:SMI1/KNR4 family protein [Streptomyces sp. NPDC005805]|uniref:SMI1/KNR4 family protein n=1 Tax=Streptomyces sp. NPDC005805 TaxID=3157068 RepID=UPI0033EB4E30
MNLTRIARGLDQLRYADPGLHVFGATAHGYVLGTPLPPAALRGLEAALGVRLPGDYRSFLTGLAASGAGPGYGLLPPGAPLYGCRGCPPFAGSPADPRRPFRLDRAWTPVRADGSWELFCSPGAHLHDGCLRLADHGCGDFDCLVVTGPRAGEVWRDRTGNGEPLEPLAPSFTTWYAEWIATSLPRAAVATATRTVSWGPVGFRTDPDLVALLPVELADPPPIRRAVPGGPPHDSLPSSQERFDELLRVAYVQMYRRRYTRAERYLTAAARRASPGGRQRVALARARLLHLRGSHDKALAVLRPLVRDTLRHSGGAGRELRRLYAVVLRGRGRVREAEAAVGMYLTFAPGWHSACELAIDFAAVGDLRLARRALDDERAAPPGAPAAGADHRERYLRFAEVCDEEELPFAAVHFRELTPG